VVNWPGVIKISGDAELVYVADQAAWEQNPELYSADYSEADYLVDSAGDVYCLTIKTDKRVKPECSGKARTLVEVLGLVKAHAAQSGSCCVSKLYAPSIREAMEIVASVNQA
jgi:hypothetical protein